MTEKSKKLTVAQLLILILWAVIFFVILSSCDSDQKEKDVVKNAKPVVTETPEQFKESCQEINYTDFARKPNEYKYKRVYYSGKVVQVQESGDRLVIRLNVTQKEYDIWDDTVWVNYIKKPGENRILEDDIVNIWGVAQGVIQYKAVLGNVITIPEVDAKYIELAN